MSNVSNTPKIWRPQFMHRSNTKSGSEGVNIEGMGFFSHVLYLILKSLMFLLCTLHCYIFCFGRWGGTLRSSRQWENPCLVFHCRRVYQIVSSLFSWMENRPGRGNFIPKQPSFTSQWLCRSQSLWHWQPIPQPKPQDWILWPFHVIRFFLRLDVWRLPPPSMSSSSPAHLPCLRLRICGTYTSS